MADRTVLRVEGLAKHFGGVRVFADLDFSLDPGELLGVIGPNGAGKTTLINVISGRIPPSAGRVIVDGRDVTGRPAYTLSRLGVGRSFQQTNTFRTATVAENLARAALFAGQRRPVDMSDLLHRFDLTGRLEEQSDKLPYGLQKLLGLLMAFASNPRLLLLDEPAAGLERQERTQVDDFVHHVLAQGCAVLIVEHDMDLIRRLCPRILVLDAGAVLAEGAPAEVLARPDVINAYLGTGEDEAA